MERKRRGWADWLVIAEALEEGRTEVLRSLSTNVDRGKRYDKAIGEWLVRNKFKEIDKGARSRLRECLQHRAEIEKWRSTLTDSQRWAFNHPDTVLKKWKASTVVPDPNAPPKVSRRQQDKDELIRLQEDNDRMRREIERGGGDLWSVNDTSKDIANIMIKKLGMTKFENVMRDGHKIIKALKAEKQS
jgi:hypothetical protein